MKKSNVRLRNLGVDLEREMNTLQESSNEKIESLEIELPEEKEKNVLLEEELDKKINQREHVLRKCRVLWDELQRRDAEEDDKNLVDVGGQRRAEWSRRRRTA